MARVCGPEDFEALPGDLLTLKGQFILSINDTMENRKIFAGLAIEEVGTTYTVGRGKAKKARELIITG